MMSEIAVVELHKATLNNVHWPVPPTEISARRMRRRSAVPHLFLIALIAVLQSRTARAGDCRITGPRYQLRSDTIEWQMKTTIGQSCIRGIRFSNVANPVIKIISPPRFGELRLLGPSFSYKAGTDFRNEDSFVIEVAGSIGRVSGTSTIRVA